MVIGVIVFAAMAWAIGDAPLAGTEGHRALTAHEILHRGNADAWVLPTLFGELYLRKPPLHYWTLAGFEWLMGVADEWTWRLPSAIAAGLTAALVSAMSRHWFGVTAGRVAGYAFLALIPLWSQSRSADIDALHTLYVTAASLFLIELLVRRPARPAAWTVLTALPLACVWMTKGPAGLPVIAAVALACALVRPGKAVFKAPRFYAALALSAAPPAAWLVAAQLAFQRTGAPPDLQGVGEVRKQLLDGLGEAPMVLAMPFLIFAYAFPLSLTPWTLWTAARKADNETAKLMHCLSLATLFCLPAFALCLMRNPRYAYIMFPLLAVTAGATAMASEKRWWSDKQATALRAVMTIHTIGLTVAATALAITQWKPEKPRGWILAAMGIALVSGFFSVSHWVRKQPLRALQAMPAVLVALAILFAYHKNTERLERSAFAAAEKLRRHTGAKADVTIWEAARNQPELFYYADVVAHARSRQPCQPTPDLPPGWIVLEDFEFLAWMEHWPDTLSRSGKIPTRDPGAYVAWYTPAVVSP